MNLRSAVNFALLSPIEEQVLWKIQLSFICVCSIKNQYIVLKLSIKLYFFFVELHIQKEKNLEPWLDFIHH